MVRYDGTTTRIYSSYETYNIRPAVAPPANPLKCRVLMLNGHAVPPEEQEIGWEKYRDMPRGNAGKPVKDDSLQAQGRTQSGRAYAFIQRDLPPPKHQKSPVCSCGGPRRRIRRVSGVMLRCDKCKHQELIEPAAPQSETRGRPRRNTPCPCGGLRYRIERVEGIMLRCERKECHRQELIEPNPPCGCGGERMRLKLRAGTTLRCKACGKDESWNVS